MTGKAPRPERNTRLAVNRLAIVSNSVNPPSVLIATLGSEPQVITLTTALLRQQGEDVIAVVVLHTEPARPPIAAALPALRAAFTIHGMWPPLQSVLVRTSDVLTPDDTEIFANQLYRVIKSWVSKSIRVHLLLAGGRKSMAMIGLSVAQLLLGADDHVWYLYSDERLRKSDRWEPDEDDDARLISIPITPLSPVPTRLTRLIQAETPAAARRTLSDAQHDRLRHFVQVELTPAERELARLVAQDVLTVQEIANALHKAPKTVTNQLTVIYHKLEVAFGLQPGIGVKREFLRRQLGEWFGSLLP